jgi:hypothetical protein
MSPIVNILEIFKLSINADVSMGLDNLDAISSMGALHPIRGGKTGESRSAGTSTDRVPWDVIVSDLKVTIVDVDAPAETSQNL